MRHIAGLIAISASLAFGGCSTVPGGTNIDLAQIEAGSQTAGKLVTAASCAVGNLAPVAGGVARRKVRGGGSLGGRSANQTIQTIAVASKAACDGLGGIFNGMTTVPASQVTPVASAT